jgi:hypothetical protein
MEFNLVQLAITVRTADARLLRRHLLMLGGSFADVCRDISCTRPAGVCDCCSRQEACPWYRVFGQKLTSDPAELKRHQKPPLPFMFSFPQLSKTVHPNEMLCELVVVGPAISQLEMLVEGFAAFLADDRCPAPAEVSFVGSCDYQGAVQPLGDGRGISWPDHLVVLSAAGLLESHAWGCPDLGVRLLSPLRLFDDGHLLDHFDFSRFARSLMRRVSSVAYYYGLCESDADFKALSRQADAVTCTENHFALDTASGRRFSGVIGTGRFQGEFSGLMPFLVLGTYLHAGKGASYGMGAYELLSGPDS